MLYLCYNNCQNFLHCSEQVCFSDVPHADEILYTCTNLMQYSHCPCAHTIICDSAPFSFRKTSDKIELVVTGPYGLVRHPVYTSLMLAIWITPSLVSIC